MIGQAQTGTGKTAAFGLPMIDFVDPEDPDTQALVLTPTRELCIQVTQALRTYGSAPRHRPRRRLRRRADPHPAGAAQAGRADRRRDGRARARPDLAPLARAALVPLPRARRGRRDARPRLPRGRREDPLADAERPPDGAVQRDDAGRDPRARRAPPLRPGHGQGQGGDADDRHRRAVLRRDQGGRQERHAGARARGRAARPGDRLRAHEDPLRPALPHAARPRDERQGAARRHEPGRSATA